MNSVQLPETYTFEEGSTIPLTYTTAGWGLVSVLGVQLPTSSDPVPLPPRNEPFLVWGGSSSVGAFGTRRSEILTPSQLNTSLLVIQQAAAAGYTVITTASAANHEYVASLGATHVFDYHDC